MFYVDPGCQNFAKNLSSTYVKTNFCEFVIVSLFDYLLLVFDPVLFELTNICTLLLVI